MTDDVVELAGLASAVDVVVDEFGVPHIYAESEDDLFRAQGYNAARDRLFQLDLWRRQGLGLLAEVFGDAYVERDRAARLFLYRGDMRAEWLAYGSATKRIVTAFVHGVNAYVERCRRDPRLLPVEFRELGYLPSTWEPRDVAVVRSHGLVGNLEHEVARALTLRDFGAPVEDLRCVREPARELRVPDGLDLDLIPDDVLDVYRLATTPAVFPGADEPRPREHPEGSNNWVVGGSRTASGRPLLANDPHRAIGVPSLRYLAHLSAPGIDVIGAGEPALPGVSIGHNGHLAFGLTIFAIDQEDLYVYRTNPDDQDEYWYDGRWEPMRVVHEQVPVAGGAPVDVELRFTRHGPVIRADAARGTAFAVRAGWLEPGTAPYLGSMDYMRARTPDEFVDAMNRWGAPGENQVYASPDGTIGWRPAGLVPVRPNWDGLLPVPGDGRYEWAGFHDADELPSLRDPKSDWIATANQMNLPDSHDNEACTVSWEWSPPYRYERIAEVLDDASGLTVADCAALQADTVNAAARQVIRALDGYVTTDPAAADAAAMLRAWDCDEHVDSAAAALYQVWAVRHLRPALLRHALRDLVDPSARDAAMRRLVPAEGFRLPETRVTLAVLDAFRTKPSERDAVLTASLAAAYQELRDRLGDDPSRWRWGALHHAALAHPLTAHLNAAWTRLPRVETAGSAETIRAAAYDDTFAQGSGASFRIVVDVGAWDSSVAMNTPGQSGVPESDHWSDLYHDWAADQTFPLCYTRPAVEAHAHTRYRLVPG